MGKKKTINSTKNLYTYLVCILSLSPTWPCFRKQQSIDQKQQCIDQKQQSIDQKQQSNDQKQQSIDQKQQSIDQKQQSIDKKQHRYLKKKQIMQFVYFSCQETFALGLYSHTFLKYIIYAV